MSFNALKDCVPSKSKRFLKNVQRQPLKFYCIPLPTVTLYRYQLVHCRLLPFQCLSFSFTGMNCEEAAVANPRYVSVISSLRRKTRSFRAFLNLYHRAWA